MYYAVTHLTIYHYTDAISDSVMEVRLQPRTDEFQRCMRFDVDINAGAKLIPFKDYLGNMIHTFDVPSSHQELAIKAESIVDVKEGFPAPPEALSPDDWQAIDAIGQKPEFYDMLLPGSFTKVTPLLQSFAEEIDWRRRDDPLSVMKELNTLIYERFEYHQQVTDVNSSIDVALQARGGVCQDFTHIMLTLGRMLGIPCRYVSGYLAQEKDHPDRSDIAASHAWLDAYMPGVGWLGFDPTNNLIVADRHIRVSLGTDYATAAPTRGVFRGDAETTLNVEVQVSHIQDIPLEDMPLAPQIAMPMYMQVQSQQQQQQQ